MKPILEIKDLSKKFKIYHEKKPYLTMRESLFSIFSKTNLSKETFWALKNISFSVEAGESLGIIGKNGAGKSTLLKILSKITPPTEGRIIARGRVASLLEVGTGFHPELTGRENIFLNGSILGMKRLEIKNKFDEIIDFSGVEQFLDTPLKHYSSGMQLRLAFSVAAFLEPEILVIDEVLAVGDAEFQKKCLGKMDKVSKSGRTILFVSHNMAAIKSLCVKGIVLKNGEVAASGNINNMVDFYLENISDSSADFILGDNFNPYGFAERITVENMEGNKVNHLKIGEPWKIKIKFNLKAKVPHFILGVGFKTIDDFPVRTVWSKPTDLNAGSYEATFIEDTILMGGGKYKLIIGLSSRENSFFYAEDCAVIEFEGYVDKEIALRSSGGIILNQMKSIIKEIEA